MKHFRNLRTLKLGIVASAVLLSLSAHADLPGNTGVVPLATGQFITPTALNGAVQQYLNPGIAAYPNFVAGQAVRSQLSPDGTTLAILCAGQNSLRLASGVVDTANSTQYIFLYDVAGANKANPVLKQVLKPVNSHVGLVFSPDGNTLYAAGGNDDLVYAYSKSGSSFGAPVTIALGHFAEGATGSARNKGVGLSVQPNAGGLAVSADGKTLVAVNNYNDSISVIDTATKTVRYEHDLRPFFAGNEGVAGGVGGTFPFAVAIKGNGTAYVSSDRDREVVVVDISSATSGRLVKRIKLDGNGQGMTLDASQTKLYVAQDNADQVAVIDTATNAIVAKIDARAPAGMLPSPKYTGAATFAVTLSRDGGTLYAVNAGSNSIAVIPLSGPNANSVTALIPTAYEPHDVTFSVDGSWMYVINGKNATGPNPGNLAGNTGSLTSITYPGGNAAAAVAARASNQYQFQLERASLVSAPVPTSADLPALTLKVAANNLYSAAPVTNPFASGIVQVAALEPELAPFTDVYFRGYDQNYPDLWRYTEWKREFDQFVASGSLPNLSMVRISHDHMGNFGTALGGFNTPETQQADCDLALGRMVETVANSPFASSTLFIVIEDDVQDGPDHVDSHRGPAFVVGPYVKNGAVVSTRFSQVNALRTIEDILGTQHINLNTAFQRPMADVFDITSSGAWSYTAVASTVLAANVMLAEAGKGVKFASGPIIKPRHSAAYWEKAMAGFDFTEADNVPTGPFNKVLWKGMMGNKPYPIIRDQDAAHKLVTLK